MTSEVFIRHASQDKSADGVRGKPLVKTVVELDLKGYSDIARELEEHFSAEIVAKFNDQIQSFVDMGLRAVSIPREQAVMATTGDGAILVFDRAEYAHRFAEAMHAATKEHNVTKTVALAQRWFRIGAATGDITMETSGGEKKIAGTTIANAVRLEAAAHIGELLIDVATFEALPPVLQVKYGGEEEVTGKRHEKFRVRRCVMVGGIAETTTEPQGPRGSTANVSDSGALKIWREKLEYLEQHYAITSSPAQKFELKYQIQEAKDKISELGS